MNCALTSLAIVVVVILLRPINAQMAGSHLRLSNYAPKGSRKDPPGGIQDSGTDSSGRTPLPWLRVNNK